MDFDACSDRCLRQLQYAKERETAQETAHTR